MNLYNYVDLRFEIGPLAITVILAQIQELVKSLGRI